ncbi:substrate-binding periplasmic protein [Aliiglaciecola litoralis]
MFRTLSICLLAVVSLSTLAESQRLRIVTEHWPPYNYLDTDGTLRGEATDNVRRILAQANLDANIELLSWSKALDLANHRPNTLIFSILRSEERENSFDWYCPLSDPIEVALYKLRKRDDIRLTDLNDAKKYTIGVLRNDYAQQFLKSKGFDDGTNLQVSTSDTANLRLLIQGRIDLVIQVKAAIHYRMKQLGAPIEEVEIALPAIDGKSLETCLALSKGSDKAIKVALDRAIEALTP